MNTLFLTFSSKEYVKKLSELEVQKNSGADRLNDKGKGNY
jgi:hypothetical protein